MEVKIGCISDLHGLHRKMKHAVPECNILLVAGDYTNRGEKHQVQDFFKWLNEQHQCDQIVIIEGNHDLHTEDRFNYETGADKWFEDVCKEAKVNHKDGKIIRLFNSSVNLFGLNIYGSPITPSFHREYWAHNADRGKEIKEYWDAIPDDTDIVMTHGPVIYKLDHVPYNGGYYTGCADLDYRVQQIKPILHVCGHIHCSAGVEETIDTTYINAAICDESYNPIQEPHLFIVNI